MENSPFIKKGAYWRKRTMKKGFGLGIIILVMMVIVSPVAACHLEVTTVGEKEECTTCDFYTYTINVKSVAGGEGDTNFLVEVKDTLPAGINFVSYTDNGPVPEIADCASPTPLSSTPRAE